MGVVDSPAIVERRFDERAVAQIKAVELPEVAIAERITVFSLAFGPRSEYTPRPIVASMLLEIAQKYGWMMVKPFGPWSCISWGKRKPLWRFVLTGMTMSGR